MGACPRRPCGAAGFEDRSARTLVGVSGLRWCEVKPDRLTLIDAKTGSRHVLLGNSARELLASIAETASGEWVFPGKGGGEPLTKGDL